MGNQGVRAQAVGYLRVPFIRVTCYNAFIGSRFCFTLVVISYIENNTCTCVDMEFPFECSI